MCLRGTENFKSLLQEVVENFIKNLINLAILLNCSPNPNKL